MRDWQRIVDEVENHGRVILPGEVWIERCLVDVTRSGEIVMVAPYTDDSNYVPCVGTTLLRAAFESDDARALSDLTRLVRQAARPHTDHTQDGPEAQ
jgi:hypothetical protein